MCVHACTIGMERGKEKGREREREGVRRERIKREMERWYVCLWYANKSCDMMQVFVYC